METYNLVIYGLIIGWAIFSAYYIYRVWSQKDTSQVIPYIYESIPTVFTTLGVLGTFVGIYFGLLNFDVNKITESIPPLLEGMKTAFSTSIWGIVLSLISGKISQIVLRTVEKDAPPRPTDELAALQEMTEILKKSQEQNDSNFSVLNRSLIGESDDSLSTQLVKLRNKFTEIENQQSRQVDALTAIQSALGGDGETSLLTQMQKMRAEQNDYSKENKNNIELVLKSMTASNELVSSKFDEFSELLAKNNTEALVNVMKEATEQFNAQMAELIDKLVKENFQELNNSVQNLNQWQKENKDMIQSLTDQFIKVSNEFDIASSAIKEITTNTTQLTNENSHLTRLITELQRVMIDDAKFEKIVSKLTETIDTLKNNTDAFDQTTEKLNTWVRNQMDFRDSVAKLMTRLEEIDKIKDINEVFWKNTEKQLNDGVALIKQSSQVLAGDLERINEEFYERLNDTLQNLDRLIQRIIIEYKD